MPGLLTVLSEVGLLAWFKCDLLAPSMPLLCLTQPSSLLWEGCPSFFSLPCSLWVFGGQAVLPALFWWLQLPLAGFALALFQALTAIFRPCFDPLLGGSGFGSLFLQPSPGLCSVAGAAGLWLASRPFCCSYSGWFSGFLGLFILWLLVSQLVPG